MKLMILPLWAWIVFYVSVLLMLVADLKMFGRKGQHEVNVKEALQMTAVWIGVSLVFCAAIYLFYPVEPHEKAMEFLAGYLIEKSLSMDNLFVFLMLFSFFGIERKYQHEVLFWGVFGALVLRSIFIFAGAAMVERFEWVLGLFGLFLLYTGGKMFVHNDNEQGDPSQNIIVRWFRRVYPVTDKMHGDQFFVIRNGRRLATPLFVALLVIETTDVAFAVDSIPAVFSVSRDPFIVLTSNIFAILGLRALYFALAAIAQYFTYLKYGLGIILIFVGVKMLLAMNEYINGLGMLLGLNLNMPHIEVPTPASLAFIFGVLVLSMLLSFMVTRQKKRLILLLAVMSFCAINVKAQELSHNKILQLKDSTFFQTQEARRIGDQLLLYQRNTGGWPKNVDMVMPLTAGQQDSVKLQKTRLDDSTIDNKATTMQMIFLARLYRQTRDARYAQSFSKAMEFLLCGQYDNGGWPQFWPKNRSYQVHITFNDNAIVNVLKLFRDVMKDRAPFDKGLVDDQMRERAAKAFNKGIDCILATQIVVDGEPTVWCQQHDRSTLLPAKARAYELPSFCTLESANLTLLLMQIAKPDERIIRAVNGAMKWFDEHKITGHRLEKYMNDGKSDIRLIEDSTATPLWARYYDLEKGESFFCDRDGQPKRTLEEIGYERRNGYGWYSDQPQALYKRYETWTTKNKLSNRVTFK